MTFAARPATAAEFPAVAAVLGVRDRPDSCWCQRFRSHQAPDNRAALRAELDTAAVPVGLIGLVDGEPAAWTRVVPRRTLPGIEANRALRRLVSPAPQAWWVACIVVRREFRGHGVGTDLLRAAVEWARDHGAAVLEGHPVDVDRLRARPSPSAVFTGTLTMFLAVGFAEVGRTFPSRPVVRRES